MPDRPHHSKSGAVAINVPESARTSVDTLFDAFGLPEPGSILLRATPDNVMDILGFKTPDEIIDGWLESFDRDFGVDFPPER